MSDFLGFFFFFMIGAFCLAMAFAAPFMWIVIVAVLILFMIGRYNE